MDKKGFFEKLYVKHISSMYTDIPTQHLHFFKIKKTVLYNQNFVKCELNKNYSSSENRYGFNLPNGPETSRNFRLKDPKTLMGS